MAEKNTTNSPNSSNSIDFFRFLGPGLYQIRCHVNGKRYIGEATNVLDRLAKHGRALQKGGYRIVQNCKKIVICMGVINSEPQLFV